MSEILLSPKSHEIDYCKSVGVHPYIPGELILVRSVIQSSTGILYTVPAGKILCLCNLNSIILNNNNICVIRIMKTPSDEVYAFVYALSTDLIPSPKSHFDYSIPMEIPEDYFIEVYINGNTCWTCTSFYGYLVDVP